MRSYNHDPTFPAKSRRRIIAVMICLAGLTQTQTRLSAIPLEINAKPSTDVPVEAHERDLGKLERQVEAIGSELTDHQSERQALLEELEERERDVAALAIAGRELDRMVREQSRVAEELRSRQVQEQASLTEQLAHLSELLRTAYAMGRADGLRLVLNQQDPVQASRLLSYFAYFNRGRVKRIQAVEGSAERLTVLAREARQEADRLKELAIQQDASRARLEQAKRERTDALTALEQTIANGQENLVILNREAENLRRLVVRLRQRAQIRAELEVGRPPFPAVQGRLSWPLLEGRVQTPFGTKKMHSELTWDGVLLEAREGEEVRAVYNGRVVFADWLIGFGMLLVIDHGDGYMTFYGHNEALLKEVGEWVTPDEVIALSGTSGGREEPVLYFAIRRNGEPLDPALWCG